MKKKLGLTSFSQLTRKGKWGHLMFWVWSLMLMLLILYPYIPTPGGEYRTEKILALAEQNIEKYRMGPIRIQILNSNGTPAVGVSVNFNLTRHEFLFGTLFAHYNRSDNPEYNTKYAERFTHLFNFATLPFYWSGYEPEYNVFPALSYLNASIQYCQTHNITTKGHNVFWTLTLNEPPWIERKDPAITLTQLQHRINTTIGLYHDQIQYWDLFNEFLHWSPRYYGLNKKEFMQQASQWARENDPNTKLILNDFYFLGHDGTSGEMYWYHKNLLKQYVDVDIIGMQGRLFETDWLMPWRMYKSLDAYANLGKIIHITECGMTSETVPITNSYKRGTWSLENQARYAELYYRVCFSHPAVRAITWWDFVQGDRQIGLLDYNLDPKPAYNTLDQLINHEWHTEGVFQTNASGYIEFRGFFGTYNLNFAGISPDQQILTSANTSNEFCIYLD